MVYLWQNMPAFAEYLSRLRLRRYQLEAAECVTRSVIDQLGLSIVVMFPRQSGKNELQAQIEAYLLAFLSDRPAELVKVSPTWKPQSLNAMRRLERVLRRNAITGKFAWSKEQGYIYRIGEARLYFLSGQPGSNIVGATANALLEVDEAQDITIEKYDREINPMAASTNATRVFWGTAWTPETLLGRELRLARQLEAQDGVRRAFVVDADRVAQETPAYGRFVGNEIARLGRNHPYVRTQYFSEELAAGGNALFPPERLALLHGNHLRRRAPRPGELVAFLVDVGGEAGGLEGQAAILQGAPPEHDSTALTIVALEPGELESIGRSAPRYRVLDRRVWTGAGQPLLYQQLTALAELWQPRRVVIDATGLGAGLAGFLGRRLGEKIVRPFVFTQKSKSELGWDFLAIVETGRFRDYSDPGGEDPEQAEFLRQARAAQAELLPGPGRLLRWGVPAGRRDPLTGHPLHDDLLVSAALCALLEEEPLGSAESVVIPPVELGLSEWSNE